MVFTKIINAFAYIIVLIVEIIKAEIDVAIRTITGNINPIVMEIESQLTRPISYTILANSITLTPGTLSIDVDPENKTLKVAVISKRDVKDIIPFEKYIKGMLE